LKIELNLPVPEGIEKNRQRRSKKCTKIPIVSSISLISGVRRINVYSEVENKAKDHRLRVLFPSSVNVDKCIADGHFGVIQREAYFKEKPTFRNPFEYYSTRNQKTFVSVSDNQYGLTIANKGLPEYEILKNKKESVVALTLFRSIGWLSRKDIITRPTHAGPALPTPDAQCLGKNIFEYSIIPHTKNWFDSMAYQAAFQFNSPLIACRAKKEKGILKDSLSLISIQPKELIISSIKKSENGDNLTVRFYNIENYPVIGYIKIYRYFKNVFLVNLNEEIIQELAIKNSDNFEVSVEPYKICSLLFHF
jgi:alpha-mannosidase